MVDYLNEKNRRDLGIVWLIAGLIFILNGFSGGVVLLFLGAVWLLTSNEKGILLFQDNPDDMRSLLHRGTIGLLALTSIVLIVNVIR